MKLMYSRLLQAEAGKNRENKTRKADDVYARQREIESLECIGKTRNLMKKQRKPVHRVRND